MTYQIETTDPITGNSLKELMNLPYVVESSGNEEIIIYFESEANRDIYLQNPEQHKLQHYSTHPGPQHISSP